MEIKKICFVVFLCISCISFTKEIYGQDNRSTSLNQEYGYPAPLGLGVHVGTTGFGLQLYKPLAPQFGVRLGFSHMPFSTNIIGSYSNRRLSTDIEAKSTNLSLIVGWTPFVNKGGFFRSFGIHVGGAYFTQIKGTLVSYLSDPYEFGDLIISPSLVGEITTDVVWKKTVNPYVGMGWSNIIIDDKFSLNVDLGMYYLSRPKIAMKANGLLEQNVNNTAVIERNIKDYRYLPRVEVGLSYRFRSK